MRESIARIKRRGVRPPKQQLPVLPLSTVSRVTLGDTTVPVHGVVGSVPESDDATTSLSRFTGAAGL